MSGPRVVVGVDGSEPAAQALAWAGLLGTPVPVQVGAGPIGEQLAEAAGDDLLVIGTHKTGFLRGRVLGSRSLRIAASATGPVAIVPAGSMDARSGIVVGVEPRLDAAPAVIMAAQHARRLGERLLIVHSLDDGADPGGAPAEGLVVEAGRIQAATAAHLVADRFPGLEVRIRSSRRTPAEAFLDASRTARLLVVGASSDDRRAAFAGSAVHDVVLNINAPLIVVPVGETVRAATLHG